MGLFIGEYFLGDFISPAKVALSAKDNSFADFEKYFWDKFGWERGGRTLLEIRTTEADASAKIIVIGVGGAGNNAVNRMIEEDIPCENILMQVNASKSAIHKVGHIIVEGHLENCIRNAIEAGESDEAINDVSTILEYYSRL